MRKKDFVSAERKDWFDSRVRMALLERVFDVTPEIMFIKDIRGVYVYVSSAFAALAGVDSVEEVIGHNDDEVFEPMYAKRFTDIDKDMLENMCDKENYKERLPDDEKGRERYCLTSKYLLKSDDGKPLGIFGICRDYTRQFRDQLYHQREVEYFFDLPDDVYYAVYTDLKEMRVIDEKRHEVNGVLLPYVYESDSYTDFITDGDEAKHFFGSFTYQSAYEIFAKGQRSVELEYLRSMPGGENRWVRLEMKLLQDPTNSHICAMFLVRDIERQRERENNLVYAAERDEMTGLYNRAATLRRIKRRIGEEGAKDCSLFMIDIDNFKQLNDTRGHQAGDSFIVAFAGCLSGCFRDNDIIGRIGGDEFFVLLNGVTDPSILETRAGRIIKEVAELSAIYEDLSLSVSIGCSVYTEGKDFNTLYAEADAALYSAKGHGKSKFIIAE